MKVWSGQGGRSFATPYLKPMPPTTAMRDPDPPGGPLRLVVRRPRPGVCVVEIRGELDMRSAPMLGPRVGEVLRDAPEHLVIDLEAVDFLGSMGLGALLEARTLAARAGTALHLAGLTNRIVCRALEMTLLIDAFRTYRGVAEACAACVGDETEDLPLAE